MSNLETMLVAGVLVPLAGFVVLVFLGSRLGKPLSGWIAVLAIATSCVLSAVVLTQWLGMDAAARAAARSAPLHWATLGSTPIAFGVNLDSLTVIMFFMVTLVSTCIFVFSVGYMAGHSDEVDGLSKYHRFFAYLCLFDFSMLLLLIADNLLLLFISWELVGLCSYLLIGYYFHKKSASNAAMKAFITNRVGDFGFIIGLGLAFLYLGELSLDRATVAFREQYTAGGPLFDPQHAFLGLTLATWMGVLLFCGAIGKSAQFPLHVWLPDAMEGPTPVSALIHAATMVAAGVYLTARIFVLLTPEAQLFVATIGCITLTLAALVAIVQTDIKKVLAYSTISQLGYMILGMGVGAWIGALFHLLTHAFFKALMFLGSGQVIEGCHHEQDIRRMGGLRRKMPVTCWTFFVGVLAIAGAGIPAVWLGGVPVGLGGYFSKDEILAVAWHRVFGEVRSEHEEGSSEPHGATNPHGPAMAQALLVEHVASPAHGEAALSSHAAPLDSHVPAWLFWIPLLMAYVTPFYMLRCWWLTFMGKPRDRHVYDHAHESPLMYLPLIVLAVGTFAASYFVFRPLVADAAPHPFLTLAYDGEAHDAAHAHGAVLDHHAHSALAPLVGGAFVVGFLIAWLIYRGGLEVAERLAQSLRPVHTLLVRKFYFDELYGLVLVGGTHLLKAISYAFDKYVVDGLVNLSAYVTERLSRLSGDFLDQGVVDGAVNGVGAATYRLGGLARSPQVGRIRSYVLFAAACLAVAVAWKAFA
ncbi:MAG: NADH-quinone oxidoreductase subunit L [Phycisphaerales bacterium]|nr:NADH-quinone oxidoreductase subunit L [Phycisphaerales bacterium]